jgi:hypothetical protein
MTFAAETSAEAAMLSSRRRRHASEQHRRRLQEVSTDLAHAQSRAEDAILTMHARIEDALGASPPAMASPRRRAPRKPARKGARK